ncbi:hypothetical protein CLV68_2084 [Actinokineospora cianjurensis]|uniref:Catalytic LigB subunit of aromatic ring-opening dioxygenase n=1 Tax=Actinokineospora cianjurensis TaxID=585224 RepID=A0A421BB36_9PSEU|nr:hypothetical protein CLV68_2084 [Actinokineospora cianjurensis]
MVIMVPQKVLSVGRRRQVCSTDSNLGPVIRRVAVVPHPPLIVPELTGGGDRDADAVRADCVAAAASFADAAPRWFVVGACDRPGRYGPEVAGTFRGFGVDVRVGLGAKADLAFADPVLPLPALVAGWLRAAVGGPDVTARIVPVDFSPTDCAAEGARIAEELAGPDPVGLLVLGDGSHRHGERSVGRPDARSAAFDDDVTRALASVDLDALARLDPALAAELGAVGRAPWQVLAGAVRADGREWRSVEARVSAPLGVAYHFAVWEPA